VLITEALSHRSPRSPNWQAEVEAIQRITQLMAGDSNTLLQALIAIALELCEAGTVGVSLLETTPNGEECFRIPVATGVLSQLTEVRFSRSGIPCGICVDRGTPQLFSHPDRYFIHFQRDRAPIFESLVLPLIVDRQILGTLWILSHTEERQFDSEDVRVLTNLANLAATALCLNPQQTGALLAANTALETEIVRHRQTEAQLRQTQTRLELSLKGANLGTWTYLVATDEFWADDRALMLHGHAPGEAKTFVEAGRHIHLEDYDRGSAAFSQAIQTRTNLQMEYRVIWRDRSVHWLASYAEFVDEQGGIFYGVVQDITEAKRNEIEQLQTETALRKSEERLRDVLNSMIEGFALLGGDFTILDVNEETLRLDGRSRDELIGRTHWEAFPGTENSLIGEIYKRVSRERIPASLEHEYCWSDGRSLWLDMRAYPTGNGSVAIFWRDVTDRKQAAEAQRESEEKCRSLFTSMDEGYFLCEVVFDDHDQPVDLLYIDENPAATRMTGQSFCGRRLREINPNYEEYWYEIFGRVARTGQSERMEQYAEPDRIWYDFYVFKVGSEDTRRIAVVFNDITDRKQNEEKLHRAAEMDAFRLKLSDALRSLSDAVEIQATVTRTTMNFFGVDRCYYCEIIDGSAIIRRDASRADLPTVVGAYPLENSPIFRAMLNAGQPFVFEDVHTTNLLDETLRETCLQLQIISGLNVPVIKQGEPVGILAIAHTTPRNWTEFEMDLAEEIADRTWATIERTRAEANLREAELQRVREQSAREQERQRAETLAELDQAKTLFFSNVSHELRTPLTLLLAPLQEVLNDRTLAPVHQERLELAHRNSLRLLKLVNTLLDFSRIEAGRMEAVYEPTDLAQFTAELASVFRSAIEQAGLRLIVDCSPLPDLVYVDREMWEKIILNLLSNAFKFTFEGEITVSLRAESSIDHHNLSLEQQDPRCDRESSSSELDLSSSELQSSTSELEISASNSDTPISDLNSSTSTAHIVLEIRDTGTGIAPEHLPHLFERFYQVRGTQARTHEGSGIGLALVNELVQLQGGTIEVTSTVGVGTCFTIVLPFGTDHLPSDRLHLEGDRISPTRKLTSTAIGTAAYLEEAERWLFRENTVEESASIAPAISTARVLLVDDNADMREYLTRILSDHVQVEAVADGRTALSVAQSQVPDLILSDVMMPGLDGFGLLQALRSDPRTREIPIILLSARAGEEAIVEGLEAGADGYLIKPFSAQELVSRINAHLQMSQLRSTALNEARSTIRTRDELLSTVSHELNTPLVSILGWTRLLRSNPPSPTILNKALDTIERNATVQAALVQDLLDISRIASGKLRLNLQPVELKSIVEIAIATVTQTAETKSIDLVWQTQADQDVLVMGDRDRLLQVLCNVLTNAIKFTPAGGSVTIELSTLLDRAEIRVIDTGVGIASDFLPHVFDRFRQARTSDATKGLGVGLAIARHLVELHQGTIRAESAGEGQGATFVICLPLVVLQ
ncbi:response regulator, partial [Pseudanabaenaceae cyanobacterium LEGE 13415]|nr:response regulator [Pseudanabaenaceae cyanobacterium LEGE 13415]